MIECIEKGFGYILDDAEKNLYRPNKLYSRLIHSRENFQVITFSRWNAYETELNISVITVILDLYTLKRTRKKSKDTVTHIV